MTLSALEFTGERFTPECQREIWYEHFHRYVFASVFANGKKVLDAACGEGYGAALLARTATNVTGIDIDKVSIAHARDRYGDSPGLHFEQADCTEPPFADEQFDLLTSFETVEHLLAQEKLIQSFRRVLNKNGMLIISSPDRKTYSDITGFRNEHHLKELYQEEFLALLKTQFPAVRLFGQKLLFQSAIWSLEHHGEYSLHTAHDDGVRVENRFDYEPLYFIAICAATETILDENIPLALSLFGDAQESVYAHYYHEIRKNMAAGGRLIELENRIKQLEKALVSAQNSGSKLVSSAPQNNQSELASAEDQTGTKDQIVWWQKLLGKKSR